MRAAALWGIFITIITIGCASVPQRIEPGVTVEAERLAWLNDEQWERLLAGEIVVAEDSWSVGELSAHRGVMLLDIDADEVWAFGRDLALLDEWVPGLTILDCYGADRRESLSRWHHEYDLGLVDVQFVADYAVIDAERKITWELAQGYGYDNDIEDLGGYTQFIATQTPGYSFYVFSTYLVTGWWWSPTSLEHWMAARRLPWLLDHARQYLRTHRDELGSHQTTNLETYCTPSD